MINDELRYEKHAHHMKRTLHMPAKYGAIALSTIH